MDLLEKVVKSEAFKSIMSEAYDDGMDTGELVDGGTNFVVFPSWETLEKMQAKVNSILKSEAQYDAEEVSIDDIIIAYFGEDNVDRYNCWGFNDEYTKCDDCYNIIRTSPTSYGWQPDFFMFDGYIACGDCIRSNPESYIEMLVNNSSAANTILDEATLEDEGWKKHDEKYETGFHHGQTDDPAKVLKRFNIKGYDVIFHIDQNSQFYTVWQAFIKEME